MNKIEIYDSAKLKIPLLSLPGYSTKKYCDLVWSIRLRDSVWANEPVRSWPYCVHFFRGVEETSSCLCVTIPLPTPSLWASSRHAISKPWTSGEHPVWTNTRKTSLKNLKYNFICYGHIPLAQLVEYGTSTSSHWTHCICVYLECFSAKHLLNE